MIHHNLGDIFINEGQLGQAIMEYVAELQSNPSSLRTHLNLAKTYEMADFAKNPSSITGLFNWPIREIPMSTTR